MKLAISKLGPLEGSDTRKSSDDDDDDDDEGSKSEINEIGDSSCTYKRLRMQTLPRSIHACTYTNFINRN
jgi:hypothetical protein